MHARGTAEMCQFLCSTVASDDNLVYLVGGETCDNPKPRIRSLEVFDMEQPEKNTITVEDVLPVGNDQMRNKHDNLYWWGMRQLVTSQIAYLVVWTFLFSKNI